MPVTLNTILFVKEEEKMRLLRKAMAWQTHIMTQVIKSFHYLKVKQYFIRHEMYKLTLKPND